MLLVMDVIRNIELLFEIGSMRNIQRGWRQHLGMDCANVLDHTLRVIWISLILARREMVKDEEKIIKMAMVHDLAETRVSDLDYVSKAYVTADEETAARDLFAGTVFNDLHEILKEYEKRDSIEAKIVKDADNLDVELELRELKEKGHQLPEKWARFRTLVRDEKLYTESAKLFWDEIQIADPASWHLKANKWLMMPDAGK